MVCAVLQLLLGFVCLSDQWGFFEVSDIVCKWGNQYGWNSRWRRIIWKSMELLSDYRGIYLTNVDSVPIAYSVPSFKNVCLKWII